MKRIDRVEFALAAGAAAAGLCLAGASLGIDAGSGYDRIGPRFFPWVVAAGLVASGLALALESLRRPRAAERTDPVPFSVLILALVLSVVLLEPLGFILTCTLLFGLVARAFRSRIRWLDFLIGLVLSTVVYFIFSAGLGLSLPRGVFGPA